MTDICSDEMPDIQNEEDTRAIPLEKVGIKNLEYPIAVLDCSFGRFVCKSSAESKRNSHEPLC